MARLIDIRYHLHYTPPSLDTSVNQSFRDKEELLAELKDAIISLLAEDCDLRVEDNNGDYLPIEITLNVLDTIGREPVKVVF